MNSINFQALFRALPSPHMIVDRNYVYLDANPAYEKAVGRRREDLVGHGVFELFPGQGENEARVRESMDRVFGTGRPDTLAYIPYAIERPAEAGGGTEQRVWSAVHIPVVDGEGRVCAVLQNTVDVSDILDIRGAVSEDAAQSVLASEVALLQRAQEVQLAIDATRQENSSFRRLFQQAPGMIAVLTGPDHVVTFANDTYLRFVGDREIVGRPIREAVPEVVGQGFFEMLDEVYREGRSRSGEAAPVTLRRHADGPLELFYMDFSYQPVRDAAGAVSGVFVQGTDRTDSVKAGRKQRALVDELNHRVKNTLSAVQSIARQSFRNIRDPEAARYAFEARILALSKAHNLLSESQWESASMRRLLGLELADVDPARYAVAGQDVGMSPKVTVALAMVFHELAMNAQRYGALGRERGLLDVRWEGPHEDVPLRVTWKESLGEPLPRPTGPGYGIRLVRRIVEGELGGWFELEFAREGVICRFEIANVEGLDAAGSGL